MTNPWIALQYMVAADFYWMSALLTGMEELVKRIAFEWVLVDHKEALKALETL